MKWNKNKLNYYYLAGTKSEIKYSITCIIAYLNDAINNIEGDEIDKSKFESDTLTVRCATCSQDFIGNQFTRHLKTHIKEFKKMNEDIE